MNKTKASVCTGLLALFVFCTLYISSRYAIRWYNTFQNIFSIFGEIMALWTFYRWLIEPSEDPKHADITVASGDTIPESWVNPFKTIKEAKKNGSHMAARNGLQDARDNGNRSESVPSRPMELVRAGYGEGTTNVVAPDSSSGSESEITIFS